MTQDNDNDMINCPVCGGTGHAYSVGDSEVTKEQYDKVMQIVPDACNVYEYKCAECLGTGGVSKEEYDDSDDRYDSWRDERLGNAS